MPSQEVQDRMDETGLSEEQVISLMEFEAEGIPLDYSLDNLDLSWLDDLFPDDFQLGDGTAEYFEANPDFFDAGMIRRMLRDYSVSMDDVPDSVKDSNGDINYDEFTSWVAGYGAESKREQRDSWDRQHRENSADFADVYDSGTTNQQLNFLYDRFEEGEIDRRTYSALAGQALMAGKEEWDDTLYYVHHDDNLYAVSDTWVDSPSAGFLSKTKVIIKTLYSATALKIMKMKISVFA